MGRSGISESTESSGVSVSSVSLGSSLNKESGGPLNSKVSIIVCVDCKLWRRGWGNSAIKKIVESQTQRTEALAKDLQSLQRKIVEIITICYLTILKNSCLFVFTLYVKKLAISRPNKLFIHI